MTARKLLALGLALSFLALPASAQVSPNWGSVPQPVAVTDSNGNPIDTSHPGPVVDAANAPYSGSTAMTVGTVYTAGRGLFINTTVAGNVAVTMSDTSILTFAVSVGLTILPLKVTKVNTSGTTATATYAELN